ncbi:MAG: tyrosine-type recombinase/integrase [Thiohalocapsa sp.]|jgi:integrase
MNDFPKRLCDRIEDYIALRQSLGYRFQVQAAVLRALGAYVRTRDAAGPLTRELALAFVLARPVTATVRARRYGFIARFAEYLALFESATELLDVRDLPRSRAIAPARILDACEVDRLLTAAKAVSPRFPMRGLTLYTLIGLLASTGLRSGEALRLNRGDVDLDAGVLRIRKTKFRKDRLVPLHPTTRLALLDYASERERRFPAAQSEGFFLSLRGGRLHSGGFTRAFSEARAAAGLADGTPRPVRPHDLRHRFAVTRLSEWHRHGVDVQTMLPILATYLGHARYTDTAYYITGTAELLANAARRAFDADGGAS